MRLKELQSYLQDVEDFTQPKQQLEQYITGPHLAAKILLKIAEDYEDLEDQVVVDLGCGTGMLSVGCALLGCPHVVGVDVDADALEAARRNRDAFEGLPIDYVRADVPRLAQHDARLRGDVVVMNPPFGSWRKGADAEFLRAAFQVSTGSVYSLHKSSTRDHIARVATVQLRAAAADVVAELAYDLPATYKHHKQKSKDVRVDLWRFEVPGTDVS